MNTTEIVQTYQGGACLMPGKTLYTYGGTVLRPTNLTVLPTNQMLSLSLTTTFSSLLPPTFVMHANSSTTSTGYPPAFPAVEMACLPNSNKFITANNKNLPGDYGSFMFTYDLTLATWTEAPPVSGYATTAAMAAANYTRSFTGMSVEPNDLSNYGGLTLIYGGSNGTAILNTITVFDANTNTWKLHAGMQSTVTTQSVIPPLVNAILVYSPYLNGTLLFGGCGTLAPGTNSLTACATLDTAYIIPSGSGSTATTPDDPTAVANFLAGIKTVTLTSNGAGIPPPRRIPCKALMLRDTSKAYDAKLNPYSRILIQGGYDVVSTNVMNDFWILDLETWQWSSKITPTTPTYAYPVFTRTGHSCVMGSQDQLFLIMGEGAAGTTTTQPDIPQPPLAVMNVTSWTFQTNYNQPPASYPAPSAGGTTSNSNGDSNTNKSGSGLGMGAKIGIAVGAVAVLALVVAFVVMRKRGGKRQSRRPIAKPFTAAHGESDGGDGVLKYSAAQEKLNEPAFAQPLLAQTALNENQHHVLQQQFQQFQQQQQQQQLQHSTANQQQFFVPINTTSEATAPTTLAATGVSGQQWIQNEYQAHQQQQQFQQQQFQQQQFQQQSPVNVFVPTTTNAATAANTTTSIPLIPLSTRPVSSAMVTAPPAITVAPVSMPPSATRQSDLQKQVSQTNNIPPVAQTPPQAPQGFDQVQQQQHQNVYKPPTNPQQWDQASTSAYQQAYHQQDSVDRHPQQYVPVGGISSPVASTVSSSNTTRVAHNPQERPMYEF